MHSRGITERQPQQRHQILLFRGEVFSQSFYESAVQESRESQSKAQRAGGHPYSICGTIFIEEYDLESKVMEVLLWSDRRVGDAHAVREVSPGRRVP